MKVLLIGNLGSIGRRYEAILKYLGVDYVTYDIAAVDYMLFPKDFDKAIIATPTETHVQYCRSMVRKGVPFLCEKPLSKNPKEIAELIRFADEKKVKGFVVNNLDIATRHLWEDGEKNSLTYDYYNHGKDTLLWDCCQLINICPDARLWTEAPIFELMVNGSHVSHEIIEHSYIRMIYSFICGDYEYLWDLLEALSMTNKVIEREKNENLSSNSSTIREQAVSQEDIQRD